VSELPAASTVPPRPGPARPAHRPSGLTAGNTLPPAAAGRRILVIEDEPEISDFVCRALAASGYQADVAGDGPAGLRLAAGRDYDLVILDLVMPGPDGRIVLSQLRGQRPDQAVLVLSCLDDVSTKVACLELGAQDYLTKPFSLAELLARVRVRLRDDGPARTEVIRTGRLVLDVGRLEADIGFGPVPLTRLEFLLLRELAEHAGEYVGKEELLASIWGLDFTPSSNVVDVCVRRLRSKLGFELIKTVRGAGYQLSC
jgi:DNA-binding response OmpR family regulator